MTVAMPSLRSWLACPPRFGTPRRPERATHGANLARVAEQLGTPLMPWQRHVGDVALEVDPSTGLLAYRRVVLTVPRQSGKTTLLLALFLHRALAMGSPQVMAFTAQNGLDARMRLRREWHEALRRTAFADVYDPSWSTGAEALLFRNGSRLQVVASTEKSGHGQTLDLAVVDEAFAQPDSRLEQALAPAMITRPEPQLWYVSTAGSPTDRWFREQVEQGRRSVDAGGGIAFFEWSAPEDVEPTDRSAWRSVMPALGHTITEARIAAECLSMAPDEFRRAYLNQWVVRGPEGAFADGAWGALVDGSVQQVPPVVFGVAIAPDRSWSAIGGAWRRRDGLTQLALVDYRPGPPTWIPARVEELAARWGEGRVLTDIAARGLVVGAEEPSAEVQARAHNALADAVEARMIRHYGDRALNTAVRGAQWRPQGQSRVLDRRGNMDISPLAAAALAYYGLASGAPDSVYEQDRGLVVL